LAKKSGIERIVSLKEAEEVGDRIDVSESEKTRYNPDQAAQNTENGSTASKNGRNAPARSSHGL
jgi:hypothetical protein